MLCVFTRNINLNYLLRKETGFLPARNHDFPCASLALVTKRAVCNQLCRILAASDFKRRQPSAVYSNILESSSTHVVEYCLYMFLQENAIPFSCAV